MTALSRRTVLATVPALAATPLLAGVPLLAAVPVIASTKPDHGKLSPAIAALVEKRAALWAEAERLDGEGERLDQTVKARGIVHPGNLSDFPNRDDYVKALVEYKTRLDAQPEYVEARRLEQRETELRQQFWTLLYDMLAVPAVSIMDLTMQIEALVEDSTIIGDLSAFDAGEGGVEFLQRLPSEIRRLAGRLS